MKNKLLAKWDLSQGAEMSFMAVIDRYGEDVAREAMRDWGRHPSSVDVFEYRCQELVHEELVQRANFLLAEFIHAERKLKENWETGFNGAEVVSKAIESLGGYPGAVTHEIGQGIPMRNKLKQKITQILKEEKT